jgi:hypothetical protein
MVWRSLRKATVQLMVLFSISGARAQSLVDVPEVTVPKFALVIGNRDYRSYPRVRPAAEDAALIANQLQALHFDVIVRVNLSYDDIIKEILDLKKRTEERATEDVRPIALVFFSGHGFVLSGRQFITGIDAGKTRPNDPVFESPAIQYIVDQLAEQDVLIGLFDACRSDIAIDRKRTVNVVIPNNGQGGQGASGQGLGSFRRPAVPKPREYLFGFANKFGEPVSSLDKGEPNSPYTKTLSHFLGNDDNIVEQLHSVRGEMKQLTPNFDPEFLDDTTRAIFLNYSEAVLSRMHEDWREAIRSPSNDSLRQFARKYGNGPLTYRALQWLRHSETLTN